MSGAARLTDMWTGICCCHHDPDCISMQGQIINASANTLGNTLGIARLTDMTIGNCGHTGIIVSGSPAINVNTLAKSRIGDLVTGCNKGYIVTGSENINVCDGGLDIGLTTYVTFQGKVIKYTEVDYGNTDDEETEDDGLNIYPPVIGRAPTPQEIARSNDLDVSPTTVVATDSTAAPVTTTPPTDCTEVPDNPPDNFQLSTNFILADLSVGTALSKNRVRPNAGLTTQDIVCNLQGWAEHVGEALAAEFGRKNMLITSGFRLGSGTSQHDRGQAADTQFPNFTIHQLYEAAIFVRDNISYDQLIFEYGPNRPWIHISFNRAGNRPSTQFNKFGTRKKAGNYVWGQILEMT
jgi:uncharacterized Zn-binding protein involved in type VI secretion